MSADTPPPSPEQPLAAPAPAPPEGVPAKRFRYVRLQPHRASTVLGLGISGVVLAVFGGMMAMTAYFCCPLWILPLASLALSIPAWTMGQHDLAEMHAVRMDPTGKDSTQVGMICGIIGVSIIALGATAIVVLVVFYLVMIAIAAATSSP